jgi:dimethylargininase
MPIQKNAVHKIGNAVTQTILQYAITRQPPASMANGITTQQEEINFLEAQTQHQNYITHLQQLGVKVSTLDPEEEYPDSHFVEDTAIIHKNVAVLTRPGALARRGEVTRIKPALEKVMTVCDLGGDDECLVDGGDVIVMGNHILIGIYDRTNIAGAERLKAILHEVDPTLEIHFIPFSGVLHLKSGLTALGPDRLLGNPAIVLDKPIGFADIVWLPPSEGYAANTLTVNGSTFYFRESSAAHAAIQDAGHKPVPFNLSEFRKMDGSFTCLSLIW